MSTVPPQPPQDIEHKIAIEKFAQYVAKNGPAFEEITRQKQHGNPKFAFLFGQDFHQYYQYRLICEIQNLQKSGLMAPLPPVAPPPPPPPQVVIMQQKVN